MNLDKISSFIKEKRKAKKLTQTELASILGVTEKAISRWETGRGTPDISLLIPLSNALDVTVLELLNGEAIDDENKVVVDIIKAKNKKIKLWKYLSLFIINILLMLATLIIIYSYVIAPKYEYGPNKGMVTILSESMAPNLNVKDTIIYDRKQIDEVRKDDIVAYYYPNTAIKTVHRVIDIINEDKKILLITKGDNNSEKDAYYVTKDNFLGVYNHKLSKFNNLLLSGDLRITANTSAVLGFLILLILSVIYLDTIQIIDFYKNK